jgi:signal transduction histidine kinase
VSLRARLLLALAYVLVLAIVALEVPLAISLSERVDAEVRSQSANQALLVAATAADVLDDAEALAALAERAGRNTRGRVLITDARGNLLADSAGDARLGDPYGNRPEIAAALAGRTFQQERSSQALGEEILATAVPVVRQERTAGVVRVTQSVAAVDRAVTETVLGLALIGLLVLVIGLALGYLIARQVAGPIVRLEEAARRVSEGDLEARAPVEGSTEQRTLAASFNEMTGRMARLLRGQQEFVADASHQLRTPLTGLRLRLDEARAAGVSPEAEAELREGEREIDRLAATIDELLILSRAGEHDAPGELLDTGDAARRAGARWRPLAAGHELEVVATGTGDHRVWCAPADLDRALDALVENALAYAPAGTRVTIVAEPAALTVLDEGSGLAAGEEAQVVERFHRGSAGRAGPAGTGLGLAIARELAGRWHGTVTIANRDPGPGAAARIDFAGSSPGGA